MQPEAVQYDTFVGEMVDLHPVLLQLVITVICFPRLLALSLGLLVLGAVLGVLQVSDCTAKTLLALAACANLQLLLAENLVTRE